LLKYKLYSESIPFAIANPGQVKKHATGKGNAKKHEMYTEFLQRTGVDLEAMLDSKSHANPISDIVDAYFITLFGIKTFIQS